MNLRSEFEPVRAALVNREISPDLDTCIQEVLREETRLLSTHSLNAEPKALLTQPAPSSADETTMFTTRGQKPRFYECKKYGHVAQDCRRKLFCNYCKRNGHVISNCTRRPNKKPDRSTKRGPTALQVQQSTLLDLPSSDTRLVTLTTAQIRETINSSVAFAFTSMGISGLSSSTALPAFHSSTSLSSPVTHSTWFLDSGASNHMTSIAQNLHSTKPYMGHDSITMANGHQLPISGMGTLSMGSFTLFDVYFVPNLAPNLISIGQLVDCGYLVHFSPSRCVIQDGKLGG